MAIYRKGEDDSKLRAAAKEDYMNQVSNMRNKNFDPESKTANKNAISAGWKKARDTKGPVSGDELAMSNYKKDSLGNTVQKFGRNGNAQSSKEAKKARGTSKRPDGGERLNPQIRSRQFITAYSVQRVKPERGVTPPPAGSSGIIDKGVRVK